MLESFVSAIRTLLLDERTPVWGRIIFAIMLLFLAVSALLLGYCAVQGLYYLADTLGIAPELGEGEIVDKEKEDEWPAIIMVGMVPIPFWMGKERYLHIQYGSQVDAIEVRKRIYKQAVIGQRVPIIFRIGRFSRGLHVDEVEFPEGADS